MSQPTGSVVVAAHKGQKPMQRLLASAAMCLIAPKAFADDAALAVVPQAIDAIYPDIEKLYIDLHRNSELAFHEQRTAATLAARVKALGCEVTPALAVPALVPSSRTPRPRRDVAHRARCLADGGKNRLVVASTCHQGGYQRRDGDPAGFAEALTRR
jgi:hypothetical protein